MSTTDVLLIVGIGAAAYYFLIYKPDQDRRAVDGGGRPSLAAQMAALGSARTNTAPDPDTDYNESAQKQKNELDFATNVIGAGATVLSSLINAIGSSSDGGDDEEYDWAAWAAAGNAGA